MVLLFNLSGLSDVRGNARLEVTDMFVHAADVALISAAVIGVVLAVREVVRWHKRCKCGRRHTDPG